MRLFWFMPSRLVIDILKWYGAEIGENVKIMLPIIFHNFEDKSRLPFRNLYIGSNSFIGRDCFIDLMGKITIQNNVTIAMGVTFITHMNVGNSSTKEYYQDYVGNITVADGTYIGARSTIIAPIEIVSGTLVGAGSVVIKNITEPGVFAGVPAKKIRDFKKL